MDTQDLKGKRVTLIGGAGFIGHHMALELKAAGVEVSIIDSLQVNNLFSLIKTSSVETPHTQYTNFTSQRIQLLRAAGIPLHIIDARDYHLLSNTLSELNPQIVVQLAAVAHAGKSNKDPFSTFDHSLRTLENALDYSRSSVEHFIYFSSSMVYGNFNGGAVTEDMHCEPIGIYGALKYAGEKMVIAYGQVFDLPYTIVRPSALYGERCISRRVGQVFLENAMDGLPCNVSGDGSDRLDFTYIKDLVHGIMQAMRTEKSKGEIFNITYGDSRSIADLIDILTDEFPDVRISYKKRDKLMPERGTLCVDKAKELLNYQPSFPLEKGYREYIGWYQRRRNKPVMETSELTTELPIESYSGPIKDSIDSIKRVLPIFK